MKPPAFNYHRAASVDEAVTLLSEFGDEASVLAGGQSLIPMLNFRLVRPAHVIDINGITDLDYIRVKDGQIALGALARQAAVQRSPEIKTHAPLMVEALGYVGHEPIRHRGTVVGSLAHADPAAEMPAVALALDATLRLTAAGTERSVSAHEFFVGPFETTREHGELVTELVVESWPPEAGFAFSEFSRRRGDFAIAGVAILLQVESGVVHRAAIALCGVAATPQRAEAAEELLRGKAPTQAALERAADQVAAALRPFADVHGGSEYRKMVARACALRALTLAGERAQEPADA
jgi:carbon-monoxide dehydrogenase medium subunit